MTTESLTYSELSERLGSSPEAARSLAAVCDWSGSQAMTERCALLSTSPRSDTRRRPAVHWMVPR